MRIDALNGAISARLRTVGVEATVQAAASSFSRPGARLVVVCDKSGKAVGVLSKSDLINHLANSGSVAAPVAGLMRSGIVSCGPADDVHAVFQSMTAQNFQSLPVLDAGSVPLGVLDIRDALKALFEEEEFEEQSLIDYIARAGYQ
jgi:CBS domain-containing protein